VVVAVPAGLCFKIIAIIRPKRGGAQCARGQARAREQVSSFFEMFSLISCRFL
jgi:hypothetical protein